MPGCSSAEALVEQVHQDQEDEDPIAAPISSAESTQESVQCQQSVSGTSCISAEEVNDISSLGDSFLEFLLK